MTRLLNDRAALDDKLGDVGWGLLLIMLGALALPSGPMEYISVAAIGALLVGLNVIRFFAGLPLRGFGIVVGFWGIVAGVAALSGIKLDALGLFFGLLGLAVIVGAFIPDRDGDARTDTDATLNVEHAH